MDMTLFNVTMIIVILNSMAIGVGAGIIFSNRKLNLDVVEKLKKFDEIAEVASNSSQSIAGKVAKLNDIVTAMSMRNSK